MVSPQLFFLLITITIGSFKVFESIRVLTQGGPGRATDVLVYFIYRNVQELQVGYAAAAGSVLMIILIILTIFYFRGLGRKVHYQ
jgi:sn-glycerol 3-phosphate transport system permease protein